MAMSFKGAHFPQKIILLGVHWYLAYPLSHRHVVELMEERKVPVDHATIQRWVVKYRLQLEAAFHRRRRPVWVSWRMDETSIRVKGVWRYYRVTGDPYILQDAEMTVNLFDCRRCPRSPICNKQRIHQPQNTHAW